MYSLNSNLTFAIFFLADLCKSGWSYFDGMCYSTSKSCKNWTEAQKTCQSYNANLVRIKNQEENVYVQHRLNGAKGWIGLSDRNIEGTFVWADNQPSNFTHWAKNQPNNYNNEDCVHTLGVKHSFLWNDVECDTCHNYTCSEGRYIMVFIMTKIICWTLCFRQTICYHKFYVKTKESGRKIVKSG